MKKLLVGGAFTTIRSANRYRLARLNIKCKADAGFVEVTIDNSPSAIAVQSAGRIPIARSRLCEIDAFVETIFRQGSKSQEKAWPALFFHRQRKTPDK